MTAERLKKINLYGSSISYFTGKLENYFVVKGIPYTLQAMTHPGVASTVEQNCGSSQMPAVQLPDGRWMSDSTPIIQWFEDEYPDTPIIPSDPIQRFFCLLMEDYADEWLWRPAMHYRWHYDTGARFASAHLANEIATEIKAPAFLKRMAITRRQRRGYTRGDGISRSAVTGVEEIYLRTLTQLQTILSTQLFLLGNTPSLADIGFAGPMFRHFGLDPIPAEIMRQQAPAVYLWRARLWNTRQQGVPADFGSGVPSCWWPILNDIGQHYLPYLCANIDAVDAGRGKFNVEIDGVNYEQARSSTYRVWCLKKLREHFESLNAENQREVKHVLVQHKCWEPLWRHKDLPIAEDFCSGLPFRATTKMIDVYQ